MHDDDDSGRDRLTRIVPKSMTMPEGGLPSASMTRPDGVTFYPPAPFGMNTCPLRGNAG